MIKIKIKIRYSTYKTLMLCQYYCNALCNTKNLIIFFYIIKDQQINMLFVNNIYYQQDKQNATKENIYVIRTQLLLSNNIFFNKNFVRKTLKTESKCQLVNTKQSKQKRKTVNKYYKLIDCTFKQK